MDERNDNSLSSSQFHAMIGENRQLVTNKPRLSLKNNRLKFKTAGNLPIISEEIIEYTPT